MRTIKIIATLSLFLGLFGVPGCGLDPCGGDLPDPLPFFDIEDMRVKVSKEDPFRVDIVNEDTLLYSALRDFQIRFGVNYVAQHQPFNPLPLMLPFTTSSFACSPIPGGYEGSKEEILTDISITTLFDYDDDHPTGSSINDLFEIDQLHATSTANLPVDSFLIEQTKPIVDKNLLLYLSQAPAENGDVAFRIKVEFSTGEVYEDETPQFWLIK
ncbi:MAG: hypothetical protein AAFY71_18395 [Bacteroidota bacterium]